MTGLITLADLEELDAEIARADMRVAHQRLQLAEAVAAAERLRARQHLEVANYNRQAARPLTP